ncbi:hypothetical protein [Pelobacter seleniigenes]|uniref:hypothetical protein n=1 Tax=Pelobacter seleniigenes TaxID=407188 RepID=UPI0004A71B94|nr:hypothetical protein [Pelobacter seleniigenes]
MRQQINLYQDVLLEKPEPLQAKQALLLLVGVFAVLALLGSYDHYQVRGLEDRLLQLQSSEKQATERLTELAAKFPPPKTDPLLAERISRVERRLAGQKEALKFFSRQDAAANEKILASLEGLARTSLTGLWLRRVSLQEHGQSIFLAGTTVQVEDVPRYLELLGTRNIFGGQVFSRLQLKRLETNAGQVDFELDSARSN